jgi:hypothetical protein
VRSAPRRFKRRAMKHIIERSDRLLQAYALVSAREMPTGAQSSRCCFRRPGYARGRRRRRSGLRPHHRPDGHVHGPHRLLTRDQHQRALRINPMPKPGLIARLPEAQVSARPR